MSPDKNRDVFESGDEGEEKQLSPLLESLARGDKNAANMVLAYEISVNDQFELNSTPPKNSVQGQVKATVERAFWDVVRDQLKNGEDDMIIPMINEIREQILNFLAPNSGTKEKVKDQIDMELIEQQFTNGCLDYKELFDGLINLLGQLCSPARDDLVKKAQTEKDVVNQMQLISNLLRLMRNDMTNYAIRQIRPAVQKQHIAQQREYWAKWAEGRGDEATNILVRWLRNAALRLSKLNREIKPIPILQNFYCIALDREIQQWPETMINEAERLSIIGVELRKQIIVASAFLIVAAAVPRQYMCIKESLKVKFAPIAEQTKVDDLPVALSVQIIDELKRFALSDDMIQVIQGQISSLSESHSIYKLLWQRAIDFLSEIAVPTGPEPPQTPKGLLNIQTELASIAGAFGKLCGLNRMVYGPIYSEKLKAMMENDRIPLTPRKAGQIDDLARTPDSPRDESSSSPPGSSGLTPRKEKKFVRPLDLD